LLSNAEEFSFFSKKMNELNSHIIKLGEMHNFAFTKAKSAVDLQRTKSASRFENSYDSSILLEGTALSHQPSGRFQSSMPNANITFSSLSWSENPMVSKKLERLWQKSAELLSMATLKCGGVSKKKVPR
jgi:hypothetical protein